MTIGELFLDSHANTEKKETSNLMRFEFPGVIYASGGYPTALVIKEVVYVRSSCMFGFLVVDALSK